MYPNALSDTMHVAMYLPSPQELPKLSAISKHDKLKHLRVLSLGHAQSCFMVTVLEDPKMRLHYASHLDKWA